MWVWLTLCVIAGMLWVADRRRRRRRRRRPEEEAGARGTEWAGRLLGAVHRECLRVNAEQGLEKYAVGVRTEWLLRKMQCAYWERGGAETFGRVQREERAVRPVHSTFTVRRRGRAWQRRARWNASLEEMGFAGGGWMVDTRPGSPVLQRDEHSVEERTDRMALVVVDVWNTHWCTTAANRIERWLVPRLNRAIRAARRCGMLVVHAPTDVAPPAKNWRAPPFLNSIRTAVNTTVYRVYPRPHGCMCAADPHSRCGMHYGWSRVHPALDVDASGDVLVPDDVQALITVLETAGIHRVVYAGVHLNLCVATAKQVSMVRLRQAWRRGSAPDAILFARDAVDAFTTHDAARQRTPDVGLQRAIQFVETAPWGFGSVQLLGGVLPPAADESSIRLAPWGTLERPHRFAADTPVTLSVESDGHTHQVVIRASGVWHETGTASVFLAVSPPPPVAAADWSLGELLRRHTVDEYLLGGRAAPSSPCHWRIDAASRLVLPAQCAYRVHLPPATSTRRRRLTIRTAVRHTTEVLQRPRRGRGHAGHCSATVLVMEVRTRRVLARSPVLWPFEDATESPGDVRAWWPLHFTAAAGADIAVLVLSRSPDAELAAQRVGVLLAS
ncbi:hypothetical protein CDCA_CDCA12G3332 [Cyanidium caldarium]|uniref:Isochorismatase-like domain-containing protein n=1 Tax=Cyanidium caldarium TaxID=2771 RepID=A0AAV9IYE2_CYACA|nr:hypothetical protein CDCA_CDCA12G3332 [Cyanidium caldarium]